MINDKKPNIILPANDDPITKGQTLTWEHNSLSASIRNSRSLILLALSIGTISYGIKLVTESAVADPLLLALVAGIVLRAATGEKLKARSGNALATKLFIPVGIFFYAVKNLNFANLAKVQTSMLILILVVILVYFFVILFLGKKLGQRNQITYLTATGSAICGASAIAITSPAVETEPDDISISLLSVALAGLVSLFTILPFLGILLDLSGETYGLLAGSVLQFTGFVKVAVGNIPYLRVDLPAGELAALALSVKATRYLGLLIAIPLFASLTRKSIYIPWFLWVFLGAGILGTRIYMTNPTFYKESLIPFAAPIYNIAWSIAMASIGLSADIKQLLSNNGIKAMGMAFGGAFAAIATFLIGLYVIQLF